MATTESGIFSSLPLETSDIIAEGLTIVGIDESDLVNVQTSGNNLVASNVGGSLFTALIADFETFQVNLAESGLAFAVSVLVEALETQLVMLGGTFSPPGPTALQSLTNGGDTISDDQAAYLLQVAEDFGASPEILADMEAALVLLSENGAGVPEDLLVNFMRVIVDSSAGEGEVLLDVSGTEEEFLLAVYLPDLAGVTLALEGMDKVLVIGEGSVRIEGDEAGMIVGDRFDQVMMGGGGSDTLVGGGGNDTLTGGAGDDVFGFNALGHYTVVDFAQGIDELAIGVEGVDSLAVLQSFLTSITNSGGNTTFNFGDAASITLVGVTATALFDDMQFTIS